MLHYVTSSFLILIAFYLIIPVEIWMADRVLYRRQRSTLRFHFLRRIWLRWTSTMGEKCYRYWRETIIFCLFVQLWSKFLILMFYGCFIFSIRKSIWRANKGNNQLLNVVNLEIFELFPKNLELFCYSTECNLHFWFESQFRIWN